MSGPIWWLSYQRTIVPVSAMKTATQARREPMRTAALSSVFAAKPIQ